MHLSFQKYQGTGNDFIILTIDSQQLSLFTNDLIQKLCDRKFGIGADGLILIEPSDKVDFIMHYFNSDGSISFCGNGARCAVHYAFQHKMASNNTTFIASDGEHSASVNGDEIALKMNDVISWSKANDITILNTGSPHFMKKVASLETVDIFEYGQSIRYSDEYKQEGINVNVYSCKNDNTADMLTYERGVENETLSCGTGATAVALAMVIEQNKAGSFEKLLNVRGGKLKVKGNYNKSKFSSIYLIGPATFVFDGNIETERL